MAERGKSRMCDLPEDVEIDGELIARSSTRLFGDKGQLGKISKSDRLDSGFSSLSPSASLESKSRENSLTVVEVDNAENVTTELETKFERLSVKEDEGIQLCESLKSQKCMHNENSEDFGLNLCSQDIDGDTLIHIAIVSGLSNVASMLIDLVDDVGFLNLQNDMFQTPLHLAVLTEDYTSAIQLIEKGASVKCYDKQGNNPLHIASRKGEKDVVEAILDSFGEDEMARKKYLAVKNGEGLTCLHMAAEFKNHVIMDSLLAHGADVNIGDAKSGRAVLHYTAEKRDLDTVTLLLAHPHIDVDCKTFKGETPLVLAFWRNHQDIVKKLRSKGAYFSYDMFEESDDETC